MRVWNLESGETFRTLGDNTGWLRCVALLPDGRVFSGSEDKTLWGWEPDGGDVIAVIDLEASVYAVTVTTDGTIVAGDVAGCVHFLRLEEL